MRMEIKKVSSASLENKTHEFLLLGFIVALGFLYIIFEWSSSDTKNKEIVPHEVDFVVEELVPITVMEPLTPPAPAVAAPPRVISPKIEIVSDPTTDVPDVEILIDDPIDPFVGSDLAGSEPELIDEPIIQIPDKVALFPGGSKAMMEYLKKHIKYPAACIEAEISGRVIVGFVVNKDGSIQDVEVLRGVNERLDAEAVRVVKSMPAWTPGEMNGIPVRSRFQLPVKFVLPG